MPEIEIRPATNDDIETLKKIAHDFQTGYVWQMERLLEQENISSSFREIRLPRVIRVESPQVTKWKTDEFLKDINGLVAQIDDEIVGYIRMSLDRETYSAWVIDLAVKKRFRRKGIGSGLLLYGQQWAIKNHKKRIILEMQSKNYPAIKFAQKMGFEFCGYNDHYYENQDIALFFARYSR